MKLVNRKNYQKRVSVGLCAAILIALFFSSGLSTGLSAEQVSNSVGMNFSKIPAGDFYRTTRHWRTKALIRWYKVRLTRDYYLGTTEVTVGQWQKVMGTLPGYYQNWNKYLQDPRKPVIGVSQEDIRKFILKLNSLDSSASYRLPTYAEWEYVAKGSDRSFFYWGDKMNGSYLWYAKNSGKDYKNQLKRVGLKRPNRYGIYDLWGNVWEWTATTHNTESYEINKGVQGAEACKNSDPKLCYPANYISVNPKGLYNGALYRIAGYAYDISEYSCTSSAMRARYPDFKYVSLGFRLVREPEGGGETDPVRPVVEPVDPVKPVIPNRPVKINPALNKPMLIAAYKGETAKVKDLLSRGADPNAKHKGWSALMYAAYYGHEAVVVELIAYNADANIKSGGWDALSLAKYKNNTNILRRLEAYTGRRAFRPRASRPRPQNP